MYDSAEMKCIGLQSGGLPDLMPQSSIECCKP